ncbi:hypothetical protein ACH4PU_13895 [Streptomyces sp. NPDC021100]|uniref:hypothetical protein n=1 Tax=Streptomyces sp. NPDC021100 TaxID=3365114 RepID=UPI0037A06FC4
MAASVRDLRPERSAEHCRGRAETFAALVEHCRGRAETFAALVEGASPLRSGSAGHRSAAADTYLVEAVVRPPRD